MWILSGIKPELEITRLKALELFTAAGSLQFAQSPTSLLPN